jgi:dihydroflavonol-4-reductase
VDVVFHLAGLVSITRGGDARLFEVNVGGTRKVVEACLAQRVRRLVHVGSVHALVEPRTGLLDEGAGFDPGRARGAYARSKAQACLDVQAAVARDGLDAVLVLPSGVIGPWDFRLSEMGQLLTGLAAGRAPLLVAGGYDWVDVRDVALGMAAAARLGQRGAAYLLGGEWRTLADMARLVSSLKGSRVPPVLPAWLARLVAAPAPLWERVTGHRALLTPYAVHTLTTPVRLGLDRARQELGFAPRPLEGTVADTLDWHRLHPMSPGNRRLRLPGPARTVVHAR